MACYFNQDGRWQNIHFLECVYHLDAFGGAKALDGLFALDRSQEQLPESLVSDLVLSSKMDELDGVFRFTCFDFLVFLHFSDVDC